MFVLFYERVPLHIENSKRMLSQFSLEALILKQGARFFLGQIHEVIILRMGVFRFWIWDGVVMMAKLSCF
jgi:hypothetical protein